MNFCPNKILRLIRASKKCARSYLKKRILVQYRGGREVQIGGILAYFEDLNRAPNPAEKGGKAKDFFEMASKVLCATDSHSGLS